MPTSAETEVVQKLDAVLPLARHGTTVAGADVKNYIRAYYRDAAVLGRRATVLLLQGSGATVGPHGTTALDERYYRGRRGCKKLHSPLLPHRSGTRPGSRGTTAPRGGTTVKRRGTTACTCGTTASTAVVARFPHNQDNEGQLQSAGKGETSVRVDSTQTFPTRTPS